MHVLGKGQAFCWDGGVEIWFGYGVTRGENVCLMYMNLMSYGYPINGNEYTVTYSLCISSGVVHDRD
jgi:hypothetical protein